MSSQYFRMLENVASYPFIDKYMDLSVARDKILINLPQFRADIWMMQIR
jgi:hypothetical protein